MKQCDGNRMNNRCLVEELCRNVGCEVTIFTEAGEFKGEIEGVSNELVRLEIKEEEGPVCCDPCNSNPHKDKERKVKCDIVIDKIVAFCRKEKKHHG